MNKCFFSTEEIVPEIAKTEKTTTERETICFLYLLYN